MGVALEGDSKTLQYALSYDSLVIEEQKPNVKRNQLAVRVRSFWASKLWISAGYDVLRDVRSIKWRSVGLAFLYFIVWNGCLATALVFIIIYGRSTSESISGCNPDGSINLSGHGTSVWAPSEWFQINLAGGSLTFSQAKVIDVIWDVVRHHDIFSNVRSLANTRKGFRPWWSSSTDVGNLEDFGCLPFYYPWPQPHHVQNISDILH